MRWGSSTQTEEKTQLLSEQGLSVLERGSGCTNSPKLWPSHAQLCHHVGTCPPPWDTESPWEDLVGSKVALKIILA